MPLEAGAGRGRGEKVGGEEIREWSNADPCEVQWVVLRCDTGDIDLNLECLDRREAVLLYEAGEHLPT